MQVYRSQVGLDGQWEGGAGATEALDAERDRRRTFEEAQQFTDAFTAEHDRVAGLQPGWPGRGAARRRRLVAERYRARWGGVLNEVAQQAAVILPPAPSAVARDLDEAAERVAAATVKQAAVWRECAEQRASGHAGEAASDPGRAGWHWVRVLFYRSFPGLAGALGRDPQDADLLPLVHAVLDAGADAVADGHAQLLSELALAAAARGPVTVSAVVGQWIYRMDRVQAEERIGAEGIAAYEQELGFAGRPDAVDRVLDAMELQQQFDDRRLQGRDPLGGLHQVLTAARQWFAGELSEVAGPLAPDDLLPLVRTVADPAARTVTADHLVQLIGGLRAVARQLAQAPGQAGAVLPGCRLRPGRPGRGSQRGPRADHTARPG